MQIIRKKADLRALTAVWKREGLSIGLVPTMGALHEGHLSLIRLAGKHTHCTVTSIFVNPTQFGPDEDLERYPRSLERDLELCSAEGVDAVFLPDADEMYSTDNTVVVDEQKLSQGLCGARRPGHFRGVLTVVAKLFNLVQPDMAVFGRKDAQQLALIQRMVRDLDFAIEIVPAPIVREEDGLAMSSRNRYLTTEERRRALCLKQALDLAEEVFRSGERDAAAVIRAMYELVSQVPGAVVDYIEAVHTEDLTPVKLLENGTLVALAVKIGNTRLIDNIVLAS